MVTFMSLFCFRKKTVIITVSTYIHNLLAYDVHMQFKQTVFSF